MTNLFQFPTAERQKTVRDEKAKACKERMDNIMQMLQSINRCMGPFDHKPYSLYDSIHFKGEKAPKLERIKRQEDNSST